MKKIFITGGAGFIGHALAKYLTSQRLEVKTFDLFPPQEIIGEHVIGTIMFTDELYQAMQGCDCVVHLAAMLGVKRTEQQRLGCLNVNIQGTINVLDAAIKAGIKKVIFASSSEVYGEPNKTPISEEDKTFPKSVYAVTKLVGEEYVKAYHQRYGLDYSIIRFFNVYGPGQVEEFVMPKLIRAALDNKPLPINGDGKPIRSFCYVEDAVRGVYLVLENEKANSQIFNIGNDRAAISMLNLAKRIISLSGKNDLEIKFLGFRESLGLDGDQADRVAVREIVHRTADISKARQVLSYEPV